MKIGVVFPQTEIGPDAGGVRAYTQAVETMGYTHVLAYDHVIGANLANRPDWKGPYSLETAFHEPFVLFSFMAGMTGTLEFATGIVILPQRQTVLVAKQAAALDVLSEGRFRMGIGIGWNEVEYESLGEEFTNRGARSEEQIALMRALWTRDSVNFEGRWHSIPDAGINPLPVQRPIPIWFGGGADVVVKRIARIADGWMPMWQPDEAGLKELDKLFTYAKEAGREGSDIGINGRITADLSNEDGWLAAVEAWRGIDADYIDINTMGQGLSGADAHIERLEKFRLAAGL
ncbi:MAG TPA: LLM class F420-dependent oxidoreductase [Dehalococcoidia bacterium]|jgi:probable F420-dependent oxidoreductase|nr:LLM class F420-dependent oxidoreductase [Chloroflexota bacterium]MDP5876869.1 LLM class F420-dependent oxidoreductase [Dehalococcoidia bacterium]MDP7160224.1 LLM class F420-dependent oxidoreductase [Dehalococcoidia bacterium]MDP7214263.1 LLM class F420-dependent oxidoreductase [Dehalococcoidia bacterium]MDP7514156.1 LLM class F420-dependent oxidoreductase [Dehalococcoidia bacterium]|tara:strand:- start:407 stop:1273 length:867 start_codon:yes stop_codon:yes gene_type:complete